MSQLQCQTGCRLGTKMTVKLCETGRKDCQRRTDNRDYRIQMPVAESPMKLHSISSAFLDHSAFLPCFDRNLSWNNWGIQLCNSELWMALALARPLFLCAVQNHLKSHVIVLMVLLTIPSGSKGSWRITAGVSAASCRTFLNISECQAAAYATRLQWSTNPQHVSISFNLYRLCKLCECGVNVVWMWCECFGCCTAWTAWTSSTFSTTELKLTRWRFSSGAAACASNSVPRSQGSFTEYILSI